MSYDNYKLTQLPPFLKGENPSVQYSLFSYGGDERLRGTKLWMNRYITWERKPWDPPFNNFKELFVTLVKVGTAVLCLFGVGFYLRKLYLNACKNIGQTNLNAKERMKVVKALGGKEACNRIPTVNLIFRQSTQYPGLQEVPNYIPPPEDALMVMGTHEKYELHTTV